MTSRIFPGMAYEDAPAAIDWLCQALGFERHFVVHAPDGSIPHAILRHGECMIMLGSAIKEGGLGLLQPRQAGGVTQTVYMYLGDGDDVRRHYEQAVAHNAAIVREFGPTEYVSVEYVCADPEGHYWRFGSYAPPAEPQEMHLYSARARTKARAWASYALLSFSFAPSARTRCSFSPRVHPNGAGCASVVCQSKPDQEILMTEDILVPIALFLVIGGALSAGQYFKYRRRHDLQTTIRTAIEKGQELPPEVLETISSPRIQPKKHQDLRRGIVLIAIGVGVGAFGFILGEEDATRPLMAIGAIPLAIGLGLAALWLLRTRFE